MNTPQLYHPDNPPPYSVGVVYTPTNDVDSAIPQQLTVLQQPQVRETAVCGIVYPSQSAIQTPGPGSPWLLQAVIVASQLGRDPTAYVCRTCNELIVTRVIRKATCKTHCCAGLLCLFMCWPCVCIPYCKSSWTNADHYCPKCSAYLGSYKG